MAVSIADLTDVSVFATAATSLTTAAMTITSNSNRAGIIGLFAANLISGITASIGGVSVSIVSGTDLSSSGQTTKLLGAAGVPSGSQTATISWTGSANAAIGATATSGVDQITPFNNGTSASGGGTNPSLAITSTNGDLTIDVKQNDGSGITTNQTLRWSEVHTGANAAGSSGPGTGTTTHNWTISGQTFWLQSGCNFNHATVGVDFANIAQSVGRFIGWIR